MAKTIQQSQAILLRKRGTSIAEIAKKLHVSKSSVSYWCRDVMLSPVAKKRIISRSTRKSTSGMLAYTDSLRKTRQHRTAIDTKKGAIRLGKLSPRDVFCIGLGLYWGEGYKHGSQEFGFTNSDPTMIPFYLHWLQSVFKIGPSDLILRVSINAQHQPRIIEVQKFWSQVTKVPLTQFTAPSFIKSANKKVFNNNSKYFGTLRIKVRRGTRLRHEILGAIIEAGRQTK